MHHIGCSLIYFLPLQLTEQFDSTANKVKDLIQRRHPLAISRIVLDNIDNIQSSWVTQGPKIGQMALYYGANDMGSVMMEENVVSEAGTVYHLDEKEICRLITDSGHTPQKRNMRYEFV